MTVKAQLVLSDQLDQELEAAAKKKQTNRSDLVRRALTLYLAALEKQEQGLKLGFARKDQPLEVEVLNL
jgi:metal-responsive CopG/Arc/MetJ family transcriptional regulator